MRERGRTVLVTGFGPFRSHRVNASWEAVKRLQELWPCDGDEELADVRLVVKEVPVSYGYVATRVPEFWAEYEPVIVLHVGVSHKADCLTLECDAHGSGYTQPDVDQRHLEETAVCSKVLKTGVDVEGICNFLNENSAETGCKACVSCDAGRYLCEYIFYHSLSIEPTRTLFVHVPDLDKYPSDRTARGLLEILRCMLRNADRDV